MAGATAHPSTFAPTPLLLDTHEVMLTERNGIKQAA